MSEIKDPRPILKAAGIDADAMETVLAPMQELDTVRGAMVGVELMRAMGIDMANAWVAGILELYHQAFDHSYLHGEDTKDIIHGH